MTATIAAAVVFQGAAEGRPVRVSELKGGPADVRRFLYCRECNGLYTARAVDYAAAPQDRILTCCCKPLRLVTRKTVIEEVQG